jgi:hypothetical protein
MNKAKWKVTITCLVVSCLLTAGTAWGEPAFIVDSNEQWNSLLYPGPNESMVTPVLPSEWYEYVQDWNQDGNAFPDDSNYCVPELYFYEGNDPCYPQNTACLVMAWGDPNQHDPDANYSSAFKFVYGIDPDLHDCTITVNVTGPGAGPVVFGLRDKNNYTIWWRWYSLPRPALIKIDTSKIYLGEPAAIAKPWFGPWRQADKFYGNCCKFDIGYVKYFVFGTVLPMGTAGAPPPGGSGQKPFSMLFFKYSVTKNVHGGKNYIKWSQQPVVLDANQPPIISGWDQQSDYNQWPIVADDWECNDSRPVTDIHWWGSFINWDQPNLPPILPKAFNIGIWTDVPKGPGVPFSHPGKLVWKTDCNNWVWNFAGLDLDPCHVNNKKDACFQFNQLLSQDQWFYQVSKGVLVKYRGGLQPSRLQQPEIPSLGLENQST